jgi:hypothetical protein
LTAPVAPGPVVFDHLELVRHSCAIRGLLRWLAPRNRACPSGASNRRTATLQPPLGHELSRAVSEDRLVGVLAQRVVSDIKCRLYQYIM